VDEERAVGLIRWYRSPVSEKEMKFLYKRSDWLASLQTFGYLGLLALTASCALYASHHWPWPLTVAIIFLHGTVNAFQINAVHELGHNTVFRSKSVNQFFMQVCSFLGWINPYVFFASHYRHHRSTLHPPEDLEVVLPRSMNWKTYPRWAFINWTGPRWLIGYHLRIARGAFEGEWELKLFPPEDPERRKVPVRWARFVLIGHGLIFVTSLALHQWLIPVLITLTPYYGAWLQVMCNETQHIGLVDNTNDFRLCSRTYILNPILQFLYWHMNYHIEHHMYVGVPCYRLGRLHRLIESDLPPTPVGLRQTWREINAIVAKQAVDPTYQFVPKVPAS
jgi:fatty acid desaturase